MKNPVVSPVVCSLAGLLTLPFARGGDPIEHPNRIAVGGRASFSVKAGFSSRLAASSVNPGPATGGQVSRTYDDGFVGVDSSNNAGGKTWFWGYESDSQITTAGDGLALNALVSDNAAGVQDVEEDFLMGGDLTYTRYLFEFGRANWGLELGAAFTPVSIADDSALTTTASAIRDVFSLGGITPPQAPYSGAFEGPGAVIADAPTRSAVNRTVVFDGRREIEAATFGLRLGPSLDIPMGAPVSLQISGGAYVLYADSEFTYDETVSMDGQALRQQTGKVTAEDWIVGAYVRGQVLVALSRTVGLFAGAEYLILDEIEITDGTHRATLDFGESFAGLLGVAFSF